jgi:acetyltransferase-like isoleucine patch superfamily enzyme
MSLILRVRFRALARRMLTTVRAFRCRKILTHGRDLHLGAGLRMWAPDKVILGNHVYIGKGVHIEANCQIGNYCLIANRVSIIGRHDHDFSAVGFPIRYAPWIGSKLVRSQYLTEKAVIEDDVWVGFGSIILTGVTIGRVPARVIRKRFSDEATIERHESSIRHGRFHLSELGYDYCVIEPADLP